MAYLYKSRLREMLDKFLQEGSSMAEAPCERTKQGFKALYHLCIQEVRRMGFPNSITILHTVEAMQWRYLWVEQFPYEVPELQELYEEWRHNEAEAKAVLDAACSGLEDTPPPEAPRALQQPLIFVGRTLPAHDVLLPASSTFRSSNQPARDVAALMAPPNTRVTSPSPPLFVPTDSHFSNNPATPPKVIKTEDDETSKDWISNLKQQLSPIPEVKFEHDRTSKYQLRRVQGISNITAQLTPKKDTPKKTGQHLPGSGGQPRALRSRNKPLYTLYDATPRGKSRMAPLASNEPITSIETTDKTTGYSNTFEMEKESPNTMQGVIMTSPPPPAKHPRRPIHPLLVNAKQTLEKRKQLHPDADFAMATPSNGFHLRKRAKHQTPF